MKLVLQIDNREPQSLKTILQDANNIKTELLNLHAGDFKFIDSSTNKTLLLIERKEVEDLCSSLTDGRFDQQKTKLATSNNDGEQHPIAFLLEGSYKNHKKESAISTIMLTTRFRDSFFFIKTDDINDTAKCLLKIAELYISGKMKPLSQDEMHRRFIASRSSHRGGGQFSKIESWWTVSLGQIPGIGPRAARTISAKYPTAKSLLDAYQQCGSIKDRRELLQSLKPAGTSRRLGPKASEKVWRCIVGDGDSRPSRQNNKSYAQSSKKKFQKKFQKNYYTSKTKDKPPIETGPVACMFVDE